MSTEQTTNNPKVQIAKLESELSSLMMKRETLKENIKLVPVRNAQILFYVGLAVCATVYGTIVGVGPIMVIAGIIYWRNCTKKRNALQLELSQLETEISKIQTDLNVAKASL